MGCRWTWRSVWMWLKLWRYRMFRSFFFFSGTATAAIYTLSLHDALPILKVSRISHRGTQRPHRVAQRRTAQLLVRSEEHTSELQSRQYLVCRLLLEKKKQSPRAQHVPQGAEGAPHGLPRTPRPLREARRD